MVRISQEQYQTRIHQTFQKEDLDIIRLKFIISCGTETPSDEIPVSDCPIDTDNDGINNNIDIDNDNDGITNCTESYGDKAIPVSSPSGSVSIGITVIHTGFPTILGSGANTFTGSAGDSFTNLAAGITNAVTYKLDFNNPISLGLKYNPSTTATASSLSNEEFVIKSDINKTITVLNPSNQLLIDTNYDGIESGVTVYSSFEIRFRLNSTILLPTSGSAPTVDFKFQTYLSKSISFTHKTYLIQIQTMRVLAFLPFAFQEILMVMDSRSSRH
jgi:hypothetical protein